VTEKIVGQWYPSEDGKGYTRHDPERDAAIAARRAESERLYIYACYLYYHGPEGIDSPLEDSEFDRIQVALEHTSQHWTDWFRDKMLASGLTPQALNKGQMKVLAHAIHYTNEEKQAALKWAKGDSNGLSERLSDEEQETGGTSGKVPNDL
jgi:hypothetical protein